MASQTKTDVTIQIPIRIAHHLLLFVSITLLPLALFQILTQQMSAVSIFDLNGNLVRIWAWAIILFMILRVVTPLDTIHFTQKLPRFERIIRSVFCCIAALTFALFLVLFVSAAKDTLIPPVRAVDAMWTFGLFTANLVTCGWLVHYYAKPLLPSTQRQEVQRRNFSDWFFDTVEVVVVRYQKLSNK